MKDVVYPAPSFTLVDSTSGEKVSLNDFSGKWLVLYFYPKDDTPACTTQACSLRDAAAELKACGADIVGISMDDASAHEQFKKRFDLPFSLLTDSDRSVIDAFGCWGKKQFGREGILRKTFIIDPSSKVRKVFGRAKTLGHGEQVLQELRRLQAQDA